MRRLLPLSICALSLAAQDAPRTVTILHTNDLHARLSPLDNGQGGFAYVAAAIRREREHCTGCLLLNAGDLVQGSPVSTIFRGLPIFEITNLFRYDAATLGNHDFDYGWRQTRKFLETANYPIVAANIADDKGRPFTPKPYVVLLANRVRVAVVGAMTDDLRSLSTPALLGPWRTTPLIDAVRRTAPEALAHADVVILLAHITEPEEHALLALNPGVKIVITGHAHKGIPAPMVEHGHAVFRDKAYGEEIGRLEMRVDVKRKTVVSWDWKQIPVDSRSRETIRGHSGQSTGNPELTPATGVSPAIVSLLPAPDVAAQVQHWEEEVARIVDRPLARTDREWSKPEVKLLIERVMREETGADFAFMNLGGVRDILPAGQLLERHIWNIMPFDNQVVVGRFKGSDLPAVVTNGHTIDPNREYTLAVCDFTATNQNAPDQLATTGLAFPTSGPLLRDLLLHYLKSKRGQTHLVHPPR
jgi:5'-nucleotidase/UDP-sugar diphosphatase